MLRKKNSSQNMQHRITIALSSYTNACVIQEICLVGVNVQNFPFSGPLRKWLKAVHLHSHSSAMDAQTRWGAMRTHWGGIEETLRRHWGGFGLYWEVQSIAIIVPNFCLILKKVDSKNLLIWEKATLLPQEWLMIIKEYKTNSMSAAQVAP